MILGVATATNAGTAAGAAAGEAAGAAAANGAKPVFAARTARLAMDHLGNTGMDLRWDEDWGVLVHNVDPLPGQPDIQSGDYIVAMAGISLRHKTHEESAAQSRDPPDPGGSACEVSKGEKRFSTKHGANKVRCHLRRAPPERRVPQPHPADVARGRASTCQGFQGYGFRLLRIDGLIVINYVFVSSNWVPLRVIIV